MQNNADITSKTTAFPQFVQFHLVIHQLSYNQAIKILHHNYSLGQLKVPYHAP